MEGMLGYGEEYTSRLGKTRSIIFTRSENRGLLNECPASNSAREAAAKKPLVTTPANRMKLRGAVSDKAQSRWYTARVFHNGMKLHPK